MTRRTWVPFAWAVVFPVLAGCQQSLQTSSPGEAEAGRGRSGRGKLSDAPIPKIKPATHFAAGQVHEREGNFPAAVEQYSRAVKGDPKFVAAFNRLGIVYDRLKLYPQADAAFQRAIELAPDLACLRNNLAFSLMLQGKYELAEDALCDALRLKPQYHRAQMNLAVVYARTGRATEAIDLFAQNLPRHVACYNVGVLCIVDQRLDEARDAFNQALALNPASREARLQLDRLDGLSNDPTGTARRALTQASQELLDSLGPPAQVTAAAEEPVLPAEVEPAAAVELPDPVAIEETSFLSDEGLEADSAPIFESVEELQGPEADEEPFEP